MISDSTLLSASTPPAIVQVDLQTIAQQIAAEHEACSTAARQSLQHAMRAGDLLRQAKAECKHGDFTPWLADNFAGSKRTAQLYMRLARNRQTIEAKSADSALLSIDQAAKLLAQPQELSPDDLYAAALDFPSDELTGDLEQDAEALAQGDRALEAAREWFAGYAEPLIDREDATFAELADLAKRCEAVHRAVALSVLRLKAAAGKVLGDGGQRLGALTKALDDLQRLKSKLLAQPQIPEGFERWPHLDWLPDLDGTGYAAVDGANNIIELLPADHRGFYFLGYSDPADDCWNHFRRAMPIQLVHYWINNHCQHFDKSTKWIAIDSPIVVFDDEEGEQ